MLIVLGSLNMDMIMRVDTLPLPGETAICPGYDMIPGGKGANQAIAATKAGAKTRLFGTLGRDDFGQRVFEALQKYNLNTSGINFSYRPTGCASISVDRLGENSIIVSTGANAVTNAAMVPDSVLGPCAMVMLQMEVPPEENWRLIRRAKSHGARVLLNLAPAYPVPHDILKLVDYLVINQPESVYLAHYFNIDTSSPKYLMNHLAQHYPSLTVIVTLGSKGAVAQSPKYPWLHVPATSVQVVDTTGAGDAFVGVLSAYLDHSYDLETSLKAATIAGGLACTKMGAQSSLPAGDAISQLLNAAAA